MFWNGGLSPLCRIPFGDRRGFSRAKRTLGTLSLLTPIAIAMSLWACLFSRDLNAQCTGPSCGVPPGTMPYSSPYNAPSVRPSTPQQPSQEVSEKIYKASVIVVNGTTASRQIVKGSGTIVRYGDSVSVMTAGHVVERSDVVTVYSQYVPATSCKVLVVDRNVDYAILEPLGNQQTFYDLSVDVWSSAGGAAPPAGSTLILAGFDGGASLRIIPATLLAYATSPDNAGNWIRISTTSRAGDSGGGVFASDGRWLGIIWGTDSSESVATWYGPAYQIVRTRPGLFSWLCPKKRDPPLVPIVPPGGSPSPGVAKPDEQKPNTDTDKPSDNKPEVPKPPQQWLPNNLLATLLPTLYVLVGAFAFLVTVACGRLFLVVKK